MTLDDLVGVYNDQGGPDVREDLIFGVAFDDVPEYFGFVEDVHFAHVFVRLPFGHLEGVPNVGFDGDFAVGGACFELHLIVAEGLTRHALHEGNIQAFFGWND